MIEESESSKENGNNDSEFYNFVAFFDDSYALLSAETEERIGRAQVVARVVEHAGPQHRHDPA
jgi:hypothetical protein